MICGFIFRRFPFTSFHFHFILSLSTDRDKHRKKKRSVAAQKQVLNPSLPPPSSTTSSPLPPARQSHYHTQTGRSMTRSVLASDKEKKQKVLTSSPPWKPVMKLHYSHSDISYLDSPPPPSKPSSKQVSSPVISESKLKYDPNGGEKIGEAEGFHVEDSFSPDVGYDSPDASHIRPSTSTQRMLRYSI